MNYFEFYDIPVAFIVDKEALRKKFYQKSKEVHPDFHTLSSEDEQEKALDKSSFNNQAYKTLQDFDARLKYVLELMDVMPEEGEAKVPQSFLMEMMDINEALMTLETKPEQKKVEELKHDLSRREEKMIQGIVENLKNFDPDNPDEDNLEEILNFYLKRRYLKRIRQNLKQLENKHERAS